MFKNTFKTIYPIIIATLVVAGISYASTGSFIPPGTSPSPQGYTLADIYKKLTSNQSSTQGGHQLSTTTSTVAGSSYSLKDIYDAIPTINPNKVLDDTIYLGVRGNVSSSCTTNQLSWSQAYYFSDPNYASWTKRLCWDASSGCSVNRGLYNHNGILLGAKEYCAYLSVDGVNLDNVERNIWRLPQKMELLMAMTYYVIQGLQGQNFPAGSEFAPLIGGDIGANYWTSDPATPPDPRRRATVTSIYGTSAEISSYPTYGGLYVRCVHN